jgi:Flp pilus assembly protein TadG
MSLHANFFPIQLHRFASDRRGVAALEFAIIALVLVTLVLGAFDFGNAAQQQVQLQEAVRAGGAYAATYPTDPTGIQNVVTNSLPTGWQLSSSPTVSCSCLDSSTGATSSTICTAPNCSTDAKIITITATMPYTTLTSLFARAIVANTATYVVRYQ